MKKIFLIILLVSIFSCEKSDDAIISVKSMTNSKKNYFKEDDRLKRYIKLYALAVFIFSILYGLFEPIFYFEKIYQLIFTIIAISFIVDDNESKIS